METPVSERVEVIAEPTTSKRDESRQLTAQGVRNLLLVCSLGAASPANTGSTRRLGRPRCTLRSSGCHDHLLKVFTRLWRKQ